MHVEIHKFISSFGTVVPKSRRSGGMADAVDSKSIVRKDVRVQLPPPAPYFSMSCDTDIANIIYPGKMLPKKNVINNDNS